MGHHSTLPPSHPLTCEEPQRHNTQLIGRTDTTALRVVLEIYNEAIYDLLPDKTKQPGSKRLFDRPPALKLRESCRGRIFVRGLARHSVINVRERLDFAEEAKKNPHTSNNNINSASSRSHTICQFEIAYHRGPSDRNKRGVNSSDADSCFKYESDDDGSVSSAGSRKGRNSTIIWIVDLAGSERSKRTGAISHTRHQKEGKCCGFTMDESCNSCRF